MALIARSFLSVCCETRETDELGSRGAAEPQPTAAYLSGLLSPPFDHAALKVCEIKKKLNLRALRVRRETATAPSQRCVMEERRSSAENNFRPSARAIRSCTI